MIGGRSIRIQIFASFLLVILVLGAVLGVFGYYILKNNTIRRAQRQVKNDLKAAHAVFDSRIEEMGRAFSLVSHIRNPADLKERMGLDYLFVIECDDRDSCPSEIVHSAFMGNATGGTRIVDSLELRRMGQQLYRKAGIPVLPTPRARPTQRKRVSSAMVMEYAMPYFNGEGMVKRVLYGGTIINRDFELIDRIHSIVYENRIYNSKPIGTVTIFQNDVRIATNVLNRNGGRAIGTRVSDEVYENVIERGQPWIDRAFVVTDWYLTAYEPIRDISGEIIGILYVGILEAPFKAILRSSLVVFSVIMGGAVLLAAGLSLALAWNISRPITRLVHATGSLAVGDLDHRVDTHTPAREINELALSFNHMAQQLEKRESDLRMTNEELTALNKRYLDLIGMVSHELKGILASTTLNAYSVRDGYLGDINETQRKALDSVTRSLEYFDVTVKNFLNLSRIEKDELSLHPTDFDLKTDIVDPAVEAFIRQAQQRGITIESTIPAGIAGRADSSLLTMIMNNLIANAIKYGAEKERILVSARAEENTLTVEVYNDGRPLTAQETQKLFRRFSRLDTPEGRRVRGTGLGLFLSKQIAERHGGTMWVEPRERGNAFLFRIERYVAERVEAQPMPA